MSLFPLRVLPLGSCSTTSPVIDSAHGEEEEKEERERKRLFIVRGNTVAREVILVRSIVMKYIIHTWAFPRVSKKGDVGECKPLYPGSHGTQTSKSILR